MPSCSPALVLMSMGCVDVSIVLLCLCGVGFSCYAIHIARAKASDQDFQATCDLDETISCTHALMSDYSKGLGIVGKILGDDHFLNLPNSYMGLLFFPIMLILSLSPSWWFLYPALIFGLISTVISAYLMYVLLYILKTICLVCMPIHGLNVLLLLLYTLKWRTVSAKQTKVQSKAQTKAGKKRNKKD